MLIENDEGIDLNSSYYQNVADNTTFVPDVTTFVEKRTSFSPQRSIHFPHKLDLSTLASPKNRNSSRPRKKISPIKANSDSRVNKSLNWSENSTIGRKKHYNESCNLDELQHSFEELIRSSQRKSSTASVTSDRASSVCSSSSGQSQKSLFVQVTRAKKLVDQQRRLQQEQEKGENSRRRREEEEVRKKTRNEGIVEDSDWNIGDDGGGGRGFGEDETDEDDTRPPSSQPSLASESGAIEQHRRAPGSSSSNLMYSHQRHQPHHKKHHQKTSAYRNTATNTTGVKLSDTQLYELYEKRSSASKPRPLPQKSTILAHDDDEIPDDDDDAEKTIVQLAFQDYSPSLETPILKSSRDLSGYSHATSNQIERARDTVHHTTTHRSASLNNILSQIGRGGATRMTMDNGYDGFAPGALRHSMSVVQVSPEKLRELERQNKTHPIRNLAQFVIKPSTRSIFPLPLMDIDAVSGKGLRKDEKSSQRHFSGQTISNQIHGERPAGGTPAPRTTTVPRSSRGADRPTTASTAKKVGFQPQSNFPPKNSNAAIAKAVKKAPYCSATSSDGTAYSISTVSQQLLGTVKSLHPDWLQMTRRLLESSSEAVDDVVAEFRANLITEQEHLEEKWKRNRNEQPFEHPDDPWTRIAMIRRVAGRLEGAGLHVSRIQQIKMIHAALLST